MSRKRECRHEWVWYDGLLGYESMVCKKCSMDINDYDPVVLARALSSLVKALDGEGDVVNIAEIVRATDKAKEVLRDCGLKI